ncbi:MAG: ABC transporter permease [Bacteroidota bacterium]
MKHIFTVFKKEILDTSRDRRTLLIMVIIPLLLFPMILIVAGSVAKSSAEKEREKQLTIGISGPADDLGFREMVGADSLITVVEIASPDALPGLVRKDSIQMGIALPADFRASVLDQRTGKLNAFYLETKKGAERRLRGTLAEFEEQLLAQRLDSLGLTKENITPIALQKIPVDTEEAVIGETVGAFIPYILIIFCFMGCMFPAIDLFTGEKERGSIETILSTPVERWKILVGKMLVLVTTGMTTAILSLVGIMAGIQLTDSLPDVFLNMLWSILSPEFVTMFLLMMLPLAIFFAGVLIPITIYAKSYKEATSIISPLNFLVIMPAVAGTIPGVELNFVTAIIPVLNVVLATKEIIAESIVPGLYILVLLSLVLYSALAIMLSFRRFGNEKNAMRV